MKALFALTLLLGLNFAAYAGEGCTKSKDCSESKTCEKGEETTEEAKD